MLGAGTQENPYIIQTPADLDAVRNNLTAYYELGNNIDMTGYTFLPIGNSTNRFTGTLDGKGYKITNLIINQSTTDFIGLFGFLQGTVKNLALENVNIAGNIRVGAIAGQAYQSTIENCYSTGSIKGSYVVGGLVGYPGYTTIRNCYSTCSVEGTYNSSSSLALQVGGFVGSDLGSSRIEKCYSVGFVKNYFNNAGGFIGKINTNAGAQTVITSCYWDTQTSGRTTSAGGIGKTTVQMKTQSTYVGWDFENVWAINNDYPKLRLFLGIKKQTINLQSYINPVHSKTSKINKSTKQTQSFLNTIQTQIQCHISTKRTISTYTLPIATSVQKSNRTVRSITQYVTSYINPISSIVERKTKTIQQLLSYINPIKSNVNVIAPIRNKVVNAYVSIIENPSIVQFEENLSNTYTFENHSNVQFEDNLSNVYAIENPSTVEVI
ncbi:GLUG motif-containing protein [Anoxybacillus rupiensis]|uniref:GLUG motif-containing protein n=1 Tax=Anoxybacteroides rupiense TaxID=311460 RepID=A0ABT5W0A4_9BACL|nr:GLUG motif-containing protein [Anoxybacillus rupiensis]MDE8562758.1 GLUG motif-containing protein [Anoxybacillus rupiensis]